MGVTWENVYIFISSTFNDMHAERDYLVKHVFPQLAEWCEQRKLRLIDIDLRWGVSEADATENKRVVKVCLDRIDACRPFFLCFLGQRRGWVPQRQDISEDTFQAFPALAEKYAGNTSVTEMEILHALMDPLNDAQSAKYAFFYLREPDYLSDIQSDRLLNIYTNRLEADPEATDARLNDWRNARIPATGRPVSRYRARWDEHETTPEIAPPLTCPSSAAMGSPAWRAAFEKWRRGWAEVGVSVSEDGQISGAQREKAKAYIAALTQGRLNDFRSDGGEALAELIIAQLKAAITERFGDRVEAALTENQRELDQQAQFLRVASEGFIERSDDYGALHGYLAGGDPRPFAVVANAGMGKTSYLAHFVDHFKPGNPNETLHYRFIGASDDSVSAERLVRSLLTELAAAGKLRSAIPLGGEDLLNQFGKLLNETGAKGRTIVVLDALNQLESGMNALSWIPSELVPGVRLIVSFKRDDEDARQFMDQKRDMNSMIFHDIRPFVKLDDRRALVTAYLSQYFKELDESRIDALISSEGADNPLFLKIALSELRVFGVHTDLSAMLRDNFGLTPVSAFDAVLRRMETDTAYTKVPPAVLVPAVFGYLAHSRYGLSVNEFVRLLARDGVSDDEAALYEGVYQLMRQLRPYLAHREGRIDFFYESFKIAAMRRYTGAHPAARPTAAWHRAIAQYLAEELVRSDRRRLMEQAWQYARAGMAEPLLAWLLDYAFMEERLNAFDTDALVQDYDCASLPEAGVPSDARDALNTIADALKLSALVLDANKDQLAQQLIGRLLPAPAPEIQRLLADAARIKNERGDVWMRPLNHCLPYPGGALVRVYQTPVQSDFLVVGDDLLLRVDAQTGALTLNEIRSGKRVREYGPKGIHKLCLGSDGEVYYGSGAAVGRLDLKTGKALELKAQVGGMPNLFGADAGVVVTQVLVGAKFIRIWNLIEQKMVNEIDMQSRYCRFAVSPAGLVAAACGDNRIRLYDGHTGACLKELSGYEGDPGEMVFSRDGKLFASVGAQVLMWDLAGGGAPKQVFETGVIKMAASLDGRQIVLQSYPYYAVYDVEAGAITKKIVRQSAGGESVLMALDESGRLIMCNSKHQLKAVDLNGVKPLFELTAHDSNIQKIQLTPDRNYAVTAAVDNTMRVWNLARASEVLPELETAFGIRFYEGFEKILINRPGAIVCYTKDYVEAWRIELARKDYTSFELSPDESLLVAAEGKQASVYDMKTHQLIQAIKPLQLRAKGYYESIFRAYFVGNEQIVAPVFAIGKLHLYDIKTGEFARDVDIEAPEDAQTAYAVFDGGRRIAFEIHPGGWRESVLQINDVATGEKIAQSEPLGTKIIALGQADDPRELLLICSDSIIRYDCAAMRQVHRFGLHTGIRNADALGISGDGRFVAMADNNERGKCARLFDAATESEIARFMTQLNVEILKLSKYGDLALSTMREKLHVFRVENLTAQGRGVPVRAPERAAQREPAAPKPAQPVQPDLAAEMQRTLEQSQREAVEDQKLRAQQRISEWVKNDRPLPASKPAEPVSPPKKPGFFNRLFGRK